MADTVLILSFQTDYSSDNVYSFSGEYEEELEKVWYDNINASDSIAYFDMMNYLITWIDRWAHDPVDPSKIQNRKRLTSMSMVELRVMMMKMTCLIVPSY